MSGPGSLIDDAITDLRARVAALEALHEGTPPPDPPDPPPSPEWLPTALPLPSVPNASAPALLNWHDVVPARASQTGVEFMEFKALAPLVVHTAGGRTLIEREHQDRWLIGDRLAGWTILSGHAAYARRSNALPAVQFELQAPTRFCLILEEASPVLTHSDLVPVVLEAGGSVREAGSFTVQTRRGTSFKEYRALQFEATKPGWVSVMGLSGRNALFYAVGIDESRSPVVVQEPSSAQHDELGAKVSLMGGVFHAWHPIIDRRTGLPNDHEHGYLTRAELLPWNLSDPTASKSGFKGIEFGTSSVLEFNAPGMRAVIPQILTHFQTSSRGRIEEAFSTFDHAVWGIPDGADLEAEAAWVPLAMLPFRALYGTPQAVYGGQHEFPLRGETGEVETLLAGSRNITVDGRVWPATANPGYEERRPSLEQADGIPILGPIVIVTDDPITRLPHRVPDASGAYPYDPSVDLVVVPRALADGAGARRWLIFPDFQLGKRYRIDATLMLTQFGLEPNPTTGLLHWIVTKSGAFKRPYNPFTDATPDLSVESPCFIHPSLRVVMDGGSGKAYRELVEGRYDVFSDRGNHISRVPLDYGFSNQDRN